MKTDTVAIIYNPISGKGRGKLCAETLAGLLQSEGFAVRLCESRPVYAACEIDALLSGASALVIAGGDGTILSLLPFLDQHSPPLYMLPLGNQSLFALEFGMTAEPHSAAAAIKNRATSEHYLAKAGEKNFFTMASVGFDSEVVQEACCGRSGPLGNKGYLGPVFRTIRSYRAPRLTVYCDGTQVVHDEQGYLIIANTKQYALGCRLVPEADSRAPVLHARFFPGKGYGPLVRLYALSLLIPARTAHISRSFSGTHFRIEAAEEYPVQADGDFVATTPLDVLLSPNKVRILRA